MSRLVVCAALCIGAAAITSDQTQLRSANRAGGFVRALEFKHQLRVCNAYPYSAPLDVFNGKEKLSSQGPMKYRTCQDFAASLKAGDKLEFKVGDASAGTFSIADLPNNDAILLLVIHRHDRTSTAVSFESHVFANLLNAQVAVIDTFKGAAVSTPKIADAGNKEHASRSEELRYDSVVAVNPGRYNVELMDAAGKVQDKGELVALNRQSYVVIRCGVEAQQGQAYPQQLIIFPKSDASLLKGSAVGKSMAALLVLVLSSAQWW